MLNLNQERNLYNQIKKGTDKEIEEATLKMIDNNMGLVYKMVLNYHPQTKEIKDEMIEDGLLGLAMAIKKFNPNKKKNGNGKFSNYAHYWIKKYIGSGCQSRCCNIVHVPDVAWEESIKAKKECVEKVNKKISEILAINRCDINNINIEEKSYNASQLSSIHDIAVTLSETLKALHIKKIKPKNYEKVRNYLLKNYGKDYKEMALSCFK